MLNEKGEPGFETQTIKPDGSLITSRMHFDDQTKSYNLDAEVSIMDGNKDTKTIIKDGEVVSHEANLLAKARMKELVRSIDSNEQLQGLQHLDVSSINNGLHIVVDNAQPTYSAPMTLPGVTIAGTIQDFSTVGRHLSLNAQYRPGSQSVFLSDISGVSGRGHQFGPIFSKQWDGNARIGDMYVNPSRVGVNIDSVR